MNAQEKRGDGVVLGRFRLDDYLRGGRKQADTREAGRNAQYRATHFFPTAEEAVQHWLSVGWSYEQNDDLPPEFDISEALLTETAMVVDRQLKRVVRVVAYRWPELGESRLPVALIVDLTTGNIQTATVEKATTAG